MSKSIKTVLWIEREITSVEALENRAYDLAELFQRRYPDFIVKTYILFIQDKKILIITSKEGAEILKPVSKKQILKYSSFSDYPIINFNETMIDQTEYIITENNNLETYYENLVNAKELLQNKFKKSLYKIPVLKIIDYKFGTGTKILLPDELYDNKNKVFSKCDNLFNFSDLEYFKKLGKETIKTDIEDLIKQTKSISSVVQYSWIPLLKIKFPAEVINNIRNNEKFISLAHDLPLKMSYKDIYKIYSIYKNYLKDPKSGVLFIDVNGVVNYYSKSEIEYYLNYLNENNIVNIETEIEVITEENTIDDIVLNENELILFVK